MRRRVISSQHARASSLRVNTCYATRCVLVARGVAHSTTHCLLRASTTHYLLLAYPGKRERRTPNPTPTPNPNPNPNTTHCVPGEEGEARVGRRLLDIIALTW
eukprot:scaffold70072_cov36-Phaeocystis_antarctica.AAC.1